MLVGAKRDKSGAFVKNGCYDRPFPPQIFRRVTYNVNAGSTLPVKQAFYSTDSNPAEITDVDFVLICFLFTSL